MSDNGSFFSGAGAIRFLSDALPDWLSSLFLGQPMARALSFGSVEALTRTRDGLVAPEAWLKTGANIPHRKGRQFVDLILPDAQLLKREVKLPKTPRRMLQRVVTLDMLRRTPFKSDQTYTLLSEVRTNGAQTTLSQWIARRDDIDTLRKRLSQAGLMVRRVRVTTAPQTPLADFTSDIYRAGRLWRSLNAISVLIGLAAGGWIWAAPALELQKTRIDLEAEVQTLTAEAFALRQGMQAQSADASDRAAFLDRMTVRTPVVSTLRAVTVIMPDDVWLTDIAFDRTRVTLRGSTSGSAAQMLLDLPRNRLLRDAQFAGPVSQTGDGRERFDIVFETHRAQP